ncbi:MAG TPA: CHAT domain-containing tetratricopeptide repeat protein [Mycobacteriales bacterium]
MGESGPGTATPVQRAVAALAQAQTDPTRALRTATEIAASKRSGAEARAVAERASGLALAELHRPAEAMRALRRGMRIAASAGLAEREGEARMSAAWVLCTMGRTRTALAEADRAEALLQGAALYRLRAQRALILHATGSTDAALTEYATAITGLVRSRDQLWEALARNNRGVLYAEQNRLTAATRDLERSAALFGELDMGLARAHTEHNLGYLAARAGDAVGALDRYQRAEDVHRAIGVPPTLVLITRAELLLGLRLADEAVQVAQQAVDLCLTARRGADLAQARLVLAEAALQAGDAPLALRSAEDALRAFQRQGRASWALVARWVRLESRIGLAEAPDPDLLVESRRLAGRLDAARWDTFALEARIAAARLAADLGRTAAARAELSRAAAVGRRAPALPRARGLYARALADRLGGDDAAARRALRRATAIVADYATALGSLDLRAGVAGHVADLTGLGVRLALDAGSPSGVLRWSELGRGLTSSTRPAPPSDDAELADLLSRLRKTLSDLREATTGGTDPRPLLRRQARIEEAIRALGRRGRGEASGGRLPPPRPTALREALGDRTLLSFVDCEGELYGVALRDGRTWMAPVGRTAVVAAEIEALLAGLRRLSVAFGAPAILAQRQGLLRRAAERLEEMVLGPFGPPGDAPLVVVPAGPLHSLPWSVLPSLTRRPVTVAPSAAQWLQAGRRRAAGQGVALVAGPDLPGAAGEIADLAEALPGSAVLTGTAATAAAALRALDGVAVAHIACHGEFRPENPLFSALRLADGPVTGYDLQRLRRVPSTVVLSACDAGRSAVTAGEGLLGLSSSLLSLGARTLVAPLVPVPDDTTRPFMLAFHGRLAAGEPADVALAGASEVLDDSPAGYVTAAAFVCLGHA